LAIKNLKNHFIFKSFYFLFRILPVEKKVDVEPFVDVKVKHGFSNMDCQLDLSFICEATSYEEINLG
jgi:hypothetical protein